MIWFLIYFLVIWVLVHFTMNYVEKEAGGRASWAYLGGFFFGVTFMAGDPVLTLLLAFGAGYCLFKVRAV